MKLGIAGGVLAVLVVAALLLGYSSLFTVYQTRQALVVRLGEPKRMITEPGLNFKIPIIDSVISELMRADGVKLTLRLEIEATAPAGFDADLIMTGGTAPMTIRIPLRSHLPARHKSPPIRPVRRSLTSLMRRCNGGTVQWPKPSGINPSTWSGPPRSATRP